jgi:methyl-accepting chemotaxis protein
VCEKLNFLLDSERKSKKTAFEKECNFRRIFLQIGNLCNRLIKGDLSQRINTSVLSSEIRPAGTNLNRVFDSLQKSIEELKDRESNLKSAISLFSSVLSSASSGDLSQKVDLSSIAEEYHPIGEDINKMISSMDRNISAIKNLIKSVADIEKEFSQGYDNILNSTFSINKAMSDITNGASIQQSKMEEMKNTMKEISFSILEFSRIAETVQQRSSQSYEDTIKGKEEGKLTSSNIERLTKDTEKNVEEIKRVPKELKKITKITDYLTMIANKTDMLGLNARIEAGRKEGASFGAIAGEIKELSKNTFESVEKAEETVESIFELIESNINTISTIMENLIVNRTRILETLALFDSISKSVDKSNKKVGEILKVGTKQNEQMANISTKIEEIGEIVNSHTASVEETTASVEEQTASLEQLKTTMEKLATQIRELEKSI